MKKKTTVATILRNPITTVLSIILGVYIGINYPVFSGSLTKYGELYLNLLKLISLPVFITAIVSGAANLARFPKFRNILGNMAMLIILFTFLTSGLGILAGIVGKPGFSITPEIKSTLDNIQSNNQVEIEYFSIVEKLSEVISDNIFYSLSHGNLLQILFFTILLGISIGLIKSSQSDFLFDFFDGLFVSLQKIINWMAVLLPIGLFCILSSRMSLLNIEMLQFMSKFIYLFYAVGLVCLLGGLIIIWRKSGQRFLLVLAKISKPVFISLSTANTLVTLPYSILTMNRELKFDKETTNMFLPIGLTIGRYGNIVFYALASVFITQIYRIDLNITSIVVIFITSIVAGLLSAGTTGPTAITLLSITLSFFNIPIESVFLILLVTDILIEPVRTLITVIINLVSTSILGRSHSYVPEEVELGVVMQNIPENIDLRTHFRDLDEEIPVIGQNKTELISAVFPNATFKKYKNWEAVEDLWNSYDVNLVIGEREFLRNVSKDISDDSKFVVLKPRI